MEETAEHFFALAPGTRVDEYKILSIIGQGSFGITYLAEDVNLEMRFAIKEYLPSDWAVRDSTKTVRPKTSNAKKSFAWGMDAFLKEARILAGITHPNIVKVRRFFRANGTAYIAMDFIEGRSFADVLSEDYPSGGFPAASLTSLLVSMLDGLEAVHRAGVVHRDIKPANILIEANGNPILIDFGAARNFQRTVAGGMTVIMTPGYAPIEQYGEEEDQGPFTDFYSLGAVAYRAIAGRAPMEPYKRLSGGAFVSAASLGAGQYDPSLLAAIDWAISIQPKDRPQSAGAFRTRLLEGKVAARQSPGGDKRDLGTVLIEPAPQVSHRRLQLVLLAALLIVGSTLGGIFYDRITRKPSDQPPATSRTTASEDVAQRAAAAAQVEQEAAEMRQRELDRQAAIAAQQEADRRAAEAAQQEAERRAAEAAQEAARNAAAVAAREAAERQAQDAERDEAARKAADAAKEAERKAAEAARQEAARKAELARQEARRNAEAARLEADRRAADAAKREAEKRLNVRDGRWTADLPRNNCGSVRVQAIAMGDVIFGNLGMPAGNRAFRAVISADGNFASAGFFDKIAGKFNGSALEFTATNQCGSWVGDARREAFTMERVGKEELSRAFVAKTAHFDNGDATYAADGSYTLNDRNGLSKGTYVISDGAICITFVSGIIRCEAILKDGAGSYMAVNTLGYSFPIVFK